MSTDTEKRYTLINYRPNGSEYIGGGDREYHDSTIGFEHNLTLDQLRRRILDLTGHHRYEGDSDCEFVVLADGKPIVSRGESLWSFAEATEPSEEGDDIGNIFDEARVASQEQKMAAAEAKRLKEEAERKKYYEQQERQRYSDAKRTINELKHKFEPVTP